MTENQISYGLGLIENNHGSGNVVISKESERNLAGFRSRSCHEPNLGKNTCFKWISQAVLDNAKVWSDTVEKPCFDRGNEFAD